MMLCYCPGFGSALLAWCSNTQHHLQLSIQLHPGPWVGGKAEGMVWGEGGGRDLSVFAVLPSGEMGALQSSNFDIVRDTPVHNVNRLWT